MTSGFEVVIKYSLDDSSPEEDMDIAGCSKHSLSFARVVGECRELGWRVCQFADAKELATGLRSVCGDFAVVHMREL